MAKNNKINKKHLTKALTKVILVGLAIITVLSIQYYNKKNNKSSNIKQPPSQNIITKPKIEDTKPIDIEMTVALYFGSGESLVVEERTIKIQNQDEMPQRVIEELIKGPSNDLSSATIPEGARLHSVTVDNAKAIVDFSAEFIDNHSGGTEAENLTIYSVVNTLTDLININKVEFLIEGQKREIFKHFTLNDIFTRSEALIENPEM